MIPEIKTILYATDLQSGSRPAFRMAVRLALSNKARLIFMTAIEDGGSNVRGQIQNSLPESLLQEIETESMGHLKDKMKRRLEKFVAEEIEQGVDFPHGKPELHVVEHTRAEKAIVELADQLDADLIVMGARRHHGLDHLLVGSISKKVMKKAHRPVLIVPLD